MLLYIVAFFAGLVNSVVGGGGLVQLPALFVFLPGAPAATLFGTNKLASVCGTLFSFRQYARHVRIDWAVAGPASGAALVCAFLGARTVTRLPSENLRPIVLVMLIAVAVYAFARKDFGAVHAPRLAGARRFLSAAAMGGVIGFYDGFLGPGTGNFLMFALIGVFGYDFLAASAASKLINAVTNLSALAYFAWTGHVNYRLALPLAVCNVLGAHVGTRIAIARGSRFVRVLFLVVVTAIILKFAYDTFRPLGGAIGSK